MFIADDTQYGIPAPPRRERQDRARIIRKVLSSGENIPRLDAAPR
ncbi:hypothetical protein [Streptomyces cellulosae]|nr:hypothetical protein [Streptomyces cellulosae]